MLRFAVSKMYCFTLSDLNFEYRYTPHTFSNGSENQKSCIYDKLLYI